MGKVNKQKKKAEEDVWVTRSGTVITEELAEQWADEIEKHPPAPSELERRYVGRPSLSTAGRSPRVSFRASMDLYQAAWKRADKEGRSLSSLAREALERYLDSWRQLLIGGTVHLMERDAALEAVFLPVQPASTFEETVARLGSAIRLGLLAPGDKLPPERELAGRMRISRSTLRQALTALVQSGHLVSLRGRTGGTFVAEQQPPATQAGEPLDHGAWEVLDYRVAIECGAAQLAAERGGEAQFDRLDELVEKMGAMGEDFEEYRRADVRFHIGIAEAAQSPRLLSAMTDVQAQMSDLISLIAHPPEVLAQSNEQHGRLVKALRRGDGARAVRQMREHTEGTEHILAGLLPAPLRLSPTTD